MYQSDKHTWKWSGWAYIQNWCAKKLEHEPCILSVSVTCTSCSVLQVDFTKQIFHHTFYKSFLLHACLSHAALRELGLVTCRDTPYKSVAFCCDCMNMQAKLMQWRICRHNFFLCMYNRVFVMNTSVVQQMTHEGKLLPTFANKPLLKIMSSTVLL